MTPHFSLRELTYSSNAIALGIDNSPTPEHRQNLQRLAQDILEPLREAFGAPLIVSSGYRSKALNDATKGASKTSQHMTGEAADLQVTPLKGESKKDAHIRLFNCAKSLMEEGKLKVGQLIDEYGYKWIHISLPRTGKPNGQILHLG